MSGGRFPDRVFAGGQIAADFACFEAASQGTIEAFMDAPSYWAAKEPAIEWFQTVPFGMNPEGMAAWYNSDGLKLWEAAAPSTSCPPRPGVRSTDGWMVPER
jgi:TRAP-type mannitol/chloroaromatic compound transport system substrate-binding protein